MAKAKLPFKREEILIVEWYECPDEIKDALKKRFNFHNDVCIQYVSEFDPYGGKQDYSDTFTMRKMEGYWKNQTKDNGFVGSLEDFIKEYDLVIDKWFIDSGYDFKGICTIYFKICW